MQSLCLLARHTPKGSDTRSYERRHGTGSGLRHWTAACRNPDPPRRCAYYPKTTDLTMRPERSHQHRLRLLCSLRLRSRCAKPRGDSSGASPPEAQGRGFSARCCAQKLKRKCASRLPLRLAVRPWPPPTPGCPRRRRICARSEAPAATVPRVVFRDGRTDGLISRCSCGAAWKHSRGLAFLSARLAQGLLDGNISSRPSQGVELWSGRP